MGDTLVSHSTLPAPPAAVFDAWTDPAKIEAWWGAVDQFTTTYTHDLRVGGAWRAEFTDSEGDTSACYGEYRRLDRPHAFALTYQFSWAPDDPPVLAEFAFAPEGSSTRVTITQTGAISDDLREDPEGGWSATLAFLRAYLAR